MTKKKFTDGLESLFDFSAQETEKDELVLIVQEKKRRPPNRKRSAGKSFVSDLDALFAQSATETEENITDKDQSASANTNNPAKGIEGLEALLRSTVDPAPYNQIDPKAQKRVTFTFDKEKLMRLKAIAKSQKAYLKDIIGKVVSDFIEEYEKENCE